MKKLLAAIFLFASLAVSATTYYVAPNGSDTNPGTISQPWATWQKGFSTVSAGDILYIRGGNYTGMYSSGYGINISNRDGNSTNVITVSAYPGEIPVLDCASLASSAGVNFGILLRSCDYWHIKGLTLKNVREYNNLSKSAGGTPTAGWELGTCTNITLEQCIVTNSGNGFTLNGIVQNIKYINCDAYMNYDYYDSGGLANGFGGNVLSSSTITYEGCRAWSNSDDGWDNYGGAGYMVYKDCWAFRNGKDTPIIGNGDGFKLGYDTTPTELPNSQRTLYNCISADNYLMGFDEGMDQPTGMDMSLYNCIAYKNTRDFGFRFSVTIGTAKTTLKNNISLANNVNYAGRTRNISDHNTWDASGPSVTDADFVSIDMTELKRARKSDGSLPDINFSKLKTGSDLIDAGINIGIPFAGNAPDLGAFETGSAPSVPLVAVAYQSSVIKNSNTSDVEAIYDRTLSTSGPAPICYEVKVNSVARSISKLTITDKIVYITLSSPIKAGETVTLSYTKPSTYPLKCTGGTIAESITSKAVVNSLTTTSTPTPTPAYVGAVVENATPDKVEINYDSKLAVVIPAAASFITTINRVNQQVVTVTIVENTVVLTLPVNLSKNDTITIAYVKPVTNPLQTTAGGLADNLTAKPVENNVLGLSTSAETLINNGKILIFPNPAHEYIKIANFDPGDKVPLLKLYNMSGKLCQEIKLTDISKMRKLEINLVPGLYIAQVIDGKTVHYIQKLIVLK